MKKLLSFVLVVVLLLSIVPITRIISFSADIVEEGPCGENVYYSLDSDGLLTLTGSGEMYGYIILNTSSIKYLKIGSGITFYGGFKGDRDLEGISVDPKNAVYTSSGNCLIRTDTKVLCLGCKNSVIPDDGSVVTVAGFGNCAGLESINIPVSVHSIGDYAFQYCTGLKSIALPQVSSIGEGAFLGCTGVKSITFSDNIISIGECAFANCTGLTSVTIPKPMYGSIRIDWHAFRDCDNLKDVYFKGSEEDWTIRLKMHKYTIRKNA